MMQKIEISKLTVRTRGISPERAAALGKELPQAIARALAESGSLRGAEVRLQSVSAKLNARVAHSSAVASSVLDAVKAKLQTGGADSHGRRSATAVAPQGSRR